MGSFKDETGNRYGRLVVESRNPENDPYGNIRWVCRCDCGQKTIVNVGSLRSGKTRSCGCLLSETASETSKARIKHGNARGGYRPSEYTTWKTMVQRCTNPKNCSFKNYGARGIEVDPRWLGENGYRNFISDMGPKPTSDHSIDRVDNDGPYSRENCRWATKEEQMNNMSTNVVLTVNGRSMTLASLAKSTGMSPDLIGHRLRAGWSLDDALNKPKRTWPSKTKP